MSTPLSREFLQSVVDGAVEELTDIAEDLIEALQGEGVWGNEGMTRTERVSFYLQLVDEGVVGGHDGQTGTLDIVNPRLARRLSRQFREDMVAEMRKTEVR